MQQLTPLVKEQLAHQYPVTNEFTMNVKSCLYVTTIPCQLQISVSTGNTHTPFGPWRYCTCLYSPVIFTLHSSLLQ